MKHLSLAMLVLLFAFGSWKLFCPPEPTPTPIPTVPVMTMTITPFLPTETDVPQDTPTIEVVPTPTTEPSPTTTLTPTFDAPPTSTATPPMTFTITVTNTYQPPEEKDTPTPKPPVKIYYTYTPTVPFCPQGGCDLLIDTDTLLDNDMLRVRFWNAGASAPISVRASVDIAWSQTLSDTVLSNSTGEVVFRIPCVKNGKTLKVEIVFPGYTANQFIDYPDCICEDK